MKLVSFKGGRDRNLSFIIINQKTKEALVVDPFENIEIYTKKAKELGLEIKGVINTHLHGDHTEGNENFEKIGVKIFNLENKKSIKLGKETVKIISTPGHSPDCKCFYFDDILLTGDVLFVNRVGMAYHEENTPILYKSLKKLTKLPKDTKVYPGHYYNSDFPTTIGKELKNNPYLKVKNLEEFKAVMHKWRLYMRKLRAKRLKKKEA